MTDHDRFRDHELRRALRSIARGEPYRPDVIDALELPPATAYRAKQAAKDLEAWRATPGPSVHTGKANHEADRIARALLSEVPPDHETKAEREARLAPVDGEAIASKIYEGRRS